jgi:DNA-binding CsgD family transcriptional regulator
VTVRRAVPYDAIRTIETCYRAVPDDGAWLGELASSLAPLAGGRATYAKAYDLSDPDVASVRVVAERGELPDFTAASQRVRHVLGAEGYRAFHRPHPPVQLMSRRIGAFPAPVRSEVGAIFAGLGLEDVLGVVCGDQDGRGVLLAVCVARGYVLSARLAARLRCVAAHVVAGGRARDRTAALAAVLDDAATEAVLAPTGEVCDARHGAQDRSARLLLRDAVQRTERARGGLRTSDPDEALALWRGLVDGTWSLVDHVDSDGRRFILARRNPPEVSDPRALLPRERATAAYAAMGHSNKYIGYMLGIAATTVASHLRVAEEKLGVASRNELIRALAGTPQRPPG